MESSDALPAQCPLVDLNENFSMPRGAYLLISIWISHTQWAEISGRPSTESIWLFTDALGSSLRKTAGFYHHHQKLLHHQNLVFWEKFTFFPVLPSSWVAFVITISCPQVLSPSLAIVLILCSQRKTPLGEWESTQWAMVQKSADHHVLAVNTWIDCIQLNTFSWTKYIYLTSTQINKKAFMNLSSHWTE